MAWGEYVIEEVGPEWFIVANSFGHYHADTGGQMWTPVIYGAFRDRAEAQSLLEALNAEAGVKR